VTLIHELLPLLKGWRYLPLDIDVPFGILPGQEKLTVETKRPGWLLSAMCALSDPEAELVVRYYDPYEGMIETDLRPLALHQAGLSLPNAVGIWVSRYDDTAKVYVVSFTPVTPLPFCVRYRLFVRAPATRPVTVLNYIHLIVDILNKDAFTESLRELLGRYVTVEEVTKAVKITLPGVRSEAVPMSRG